MGAPRFYIPPKRWSEQNLELDAAESHHCTEVLRLGPGARVVVFNGRGLEITAEIISAGKPGVRLRPLLRSKSPAMNCAITLAQAIPKGKNMDLIAQKATELGVHRIVPLLSERTVVQLEGTEGSRKADKWRQIVIEAAKQCGQNWLPEVAEPLTPKQFLAQHDQFDLRLIASLQDDARDLKGVLAETETHLRRAPESVLVLIGPEGDFTPAEAGLARSAGCIPISLGPIVLRTETAAIYTLSVLSYELQGKRR